jgi:hypothetical protein
MTDEQYDPSAHTVDEVNAYLADADEAERTRVLEAEAQGKNRTTVKAPESTDDGTTPGLDTSKADTLQEAGEKAIEPQGEAYVKGYFGHVPSRDGDKPMDLTLAAVTGQKDA